MKSCLFLTSAFAAALLMACSQSKEVASQDITLEPLELSGDEAIIGNVLSMQRIGRYLVLSDTKIDSLYHIIDIEANRYLGQAGRKGNGPGEFANITLTTPIPGSDNSFGIFEPNIKRYTVATINPVGDSIAISYSKPITINGEAWQLVKLANGNFVSSPAYSEHSELFSLFSPQGKQFALTAQRPLPAKAASLKPMQTTAAWQYSLAASPDGSKLSAMGTGEAAAFFKTEGDSLICTGSFFNEAADLDHNFNSDMYMGISGDVPFGFVAQAVSDSNIYIVSSDKSLNEGSDDTSYASGNTIYVYDWNANRTAIIHTDKRVRHITTPTADGSFYALTQDGCEPTIVKFKL